MTNPVTFDLAIARIRSMSEKEYGENLTVFMDEHPALFGFLMNLSEEFDDDEHEQLVRTAMLLREGFRLAALTIQSITSVIIQDVTREVVENIEKIDSEDGPNMEEMVKISRSPFVFSELRNFLHQELKSGLRERKGQQHNLMVLVDILIGSFEEAIDIPEAKKSE